MCWRTPAPRLATYVPFLDAVGTPIDHGLAIFFPAPHSYTGEDVLELQAHGGPVVLQLLLARCLEAAAERDAATNGERLPHLRIAGPGEFTERAFLNDKLDLAQADGQPLEGTCDGDMACATCHVIVDPADFDRLGAASEEEEELLDLAFNATRTSRLACQIRLGPALDGLTVRVP